MTFFIIEYVFVTFILYFILNFLKHSSALLRNSLYGPAVKYFTLLISFDSRLSEYKNIYLLTVYYILDVK